MAELNKAKKEKCPPGKDCGVKKDPPVIASLTKKQFHFSIWYFIAALLILHFINNYLVQTSQKTIEFSEFKKKILSGEIKRVEMTSDFFIGLPYVREELEDAAQKKLQDKMAMAKKTVYKTVPVAESNIVPLLDSLNIEYYAKSEKPNRFLDFIFTWVLPIFVMLFIWRLLFKRMGMPGQGVMAFGQNKARLVAEGDTNTTFEDVAGADEAKDELVEVVDYLKTPEKYTSIGGKIPKGILLVGPPGTGKTLLARAVAGEAKVAFFRMSGADFVEMFVGVGAARVRDLFKQAREKAPCIIFIDELDAIGKSRAPVAGGNDEREQTLNQLLVEMDGFDARAGVIILAATNRPEVLDPALLRPGRFDRQVLVDKPDLKGREEILRLHAKEIVLDHSVNLTEVARSSAGFAGADLANIVNEAALLAVRAGRKAAVQEDFEEAIEKVIAGLRKKNRLINKKERERVAFHETGHALVAVLTPDSDPVQKITIVPRGLGALGYTIQLPTDDKFLMTRNELLGRVDVLLGGRAAEQLIFGEISTGAANDLEKVTDIARRMITDYGMSEKYENMVLRSRTGPSFLGDQGGTFNREYSENTQLYIDEQVARIIGERYGAVRKLLSDRESTLRTVAAALLEKETIGAAEFRELIGDINSVTQS